MEELSLKKTSLGAFAGGYVEVLRTGKTSKQEIEKGGEVVI